MHRPVGAFGSPNHHHVVLMNWARLRSVNIGRHGYAGLALFVDFSPLAFVVEYRGPGRPPMRKVFPFVTGQRKAAFKAALDAFTRARA